MAHVVSSGTDTENDTVYIVYDMEMVGNVYDPQNCHVWNIAAKNYHRTDQKYHQYVLPPLKRLPPPPHPDLFPVTIALLHQQQARQWTVIGPEFLGWLETQRIGEGRVVLMSHGNFSFDKPVFEIEYGRLDQVVPHHILFMDTLATFRSHVRKQTSYSLKSIYSLYFGTSIPNQHFAMADVEALHAVLLKMTGEKGFDVRQLEAIYYPGYYTPLCCVKGIGAYNERLLVSGGIHSFELLKMKFVEECRLDVNRLSEVLNDVYHVSLGSAMQIANSLLTMTLQRIGT